MSTGELLSFNEPHKPTERALEAFGQVLPTIKSEIIKSRHDWDKHEPKMWSRAHGISNDDLTAFTLEDLVLISSASTSYGQIILGKIRIPAVNDDLGEGYIHVRIHDPPNQGTDDVIYHSLFTDEGHKTKEGHPTTWRAIQTKDEPLAFFNE